MPIIQVSLVEGRDRAKLKKLIAALTDATVNTLEAPPESIKVVINEIPDELWGSAGETIADRRARQQGS